MIHRKYAKAGYWFALGLLLVVAYYGPGCSTESVSSSPSSATSMASWIVLAAVNQLVWGGVGLGLSCHTYRVAAHAVCETIVMTETPVAIAIQNGHEALMIASRKLRIA